MGDMAGFVLCVDGQDGESVSFSVPLRGFPDGWKLRTGEKVVVTGDGSDIVAMPLLESTELDSMEPLEAGAEAVINGRRHAIQDATVIGDGGGKRTVMWTVVEGTAGEPLQVFAVSTAG